MINHVGFNPPELCVCAAAIIISIGIGFVSIAGLPEKTSAPMNDANVRYLSALKRY